MDSTSRKLKPPKEFRWQPYNVAGINLMTMDKSLRSRKGMVRARSVLNRAERLARLQEAERWKPGDCPIGLPKVRVYKLTMKKKKKAKAEEGAEGAAAATPAAGAAATAKAPAGKEAPKKK